MPSSNQVLFYLLNSKAQKSFWDSKTVIFWWFLFCCQMFTSYRRALQHTHTQIHKLAHVPIARQSTPEVLPCRSMTNTVDIDKLQACEILDDVYCMYISLICMWILCLKRYLQGIFVATHKNCQVAR